LDDRAAVSDDDEQQRRAFNPEPQSRLEALAWLAMFGATLAILKSYELGARTWRRVRGWLR
jgi:hypothetical protein